MKATSTSDRGHPWNVPRHPGLLAVDSIASIIVKAHLHQGFVSSSYDPSRRVDSILRDERPERAKRRDFVWFEVQTGADEGQPDNRLR